MTRSSYSFTVAATAAACQFDIGGGKTPCRTLAMIHRCASHRVLVESWLMDCCEQAGPSPGIDLGMLALRGERDLLQLPASEQLRLRYNP